MNRPLRTALALLPLLAASLLPLKSVQAASSCPGFIPATIATPANLITAINQAQSTNCPGADTIDLGGNTVSLTMSGYSDGGTALGLPPITTPVTLANGTIARSSGTSFRFLVVNAGGALTLSNLTLSNGGGGVADGGAVRVGDGSLAAVSATFLNNTALSNGGAVLIGGTGPAQFTDTVFQGNQSGQFGGAIAITSAASDVVVSRSRFLGNVAGSHGGAVSVTEFSMLQINDSLFAGNAAAVAGAALYQAAGVVVVTGTTMAGNRGSAVDLGNGTNSTFSNSLIWGNNGGSFTGVPMVVLYIAADGYAGATINTGYTADDFFVSPLTAPTAGNTGLNFNPALYDWRLRPFSPAIDAGSNSSTTSTLDLDADPRRVDDTNVSDTGSGTAPLPDMGAYERQSGSCTSYAYPYTLAGVTNTPRRLNLRDAVRCANLNGTDDAIDMGGQTVTYDAPYATFDGTPTALPQITSTLTLRNGQIARSTVAGTPNFRLLSNAVGGRLTLSGMSLRNGNAGNVAGSSRGGAVFNLGTLTIRQSTLADNTAYSAGALHNGVGANVVIERSTLADNTATAGASAVYSEGFGVLSNSTVSGNSSSAAVSAITAAIGSQLTVVNSTVVDNINTSTTTSAGLGSSGTTQLYNSILANNTPYDCARLDGTISFSAGRSNIVETQPAASPCGVAGTDLMTADPQLGAPSGSPAWYPISTAASPAVNAGDSANLGGATVDQPGAARVQGPRVDLGSVESPYAGQQATLAFAVATSNAAEAAGFGNLVRVTTSDGAVTASPITATVSVTGGTATAADYTLTGTLTIPAGTPDNTLLSVASAVSVVDDCLVEPNETVQLTLSAPSGAVLGAQASTTHTISNDDMAALTITDVSRAEGNAGSSIMTFTVSLDNPVQGGLSVDYATTGLTATTVDNDFVAASGALVFVGTAGETHTFNVTVNGDTKVEANETFQVSMPTAAGTMAPGSLIITDTATGTITNDDTADVTIADASVTEGNAGTVTMTFTATLDSAVQGGFTVNYATTNGTATTADADYVAATGTLTFAGTAGETRSFNVTVNGDTRVEPSETFTVSMNTVSNAGVTVTDTATGTIANDDTAQLTIADVSVSEGNAGTRNLIFTVALDSAVAGGFTVDYATANGTATTTDNDYAAASGTLSFTGTAGQTRTFIVVANGDTKLEADETFTVALSNVSNAAVDISDTATGTITNDDAAAVIIANVSMAEGNTGTATMTFTATLNNAVQGGFTVDYATANGTATTADNDYVAATGTLTFAGTAGEMQTFAVTVNGDTRLEPDETFAVSMNTVSSAGVNIADTAVGTITNDDSAAVTIADVSVIEGNAGTATMTFTATLNDTVAGGFTVNYATANGTATIGDNDYVAATGTLAFAGTAGETQIFAVTINGDARVELNETFTVSMNTVSNAAVTISDTATGTIANDDVATLTIADVSVTEGNTGTRNLTFIATLDKATLGAFNVNIATADGTATTADNDYVAATDNLDFTGMPGETRTFVVVVNGDTKLEADETFTVSMDNVSSATVMIADTATGTITNDDAAAVTIADVSIAEGNTGTSTMTFTAALNNAVAGGFTVNYSTVNGTATTADNDYAAAAGTLTFAGAAGETQTFTVTINGDIRFEPDETLTIALSGVSNAAVGTSDTATGTIVDDDTAPGFVVTPTAVQTTEAGGSATFTVVLAAEPGATVTLPLSSNDTGEGSVSPATLTFTTANWATAQTVTVTGVDDAVVDGSIAYTVVLGAATSGDPAFNGMDPPDVSATNADNDIAGVRVTPTALTATEGGTGASYTVVLDSEPVGGSVTVSVNTDSQVTATPAALVFTAANWNVAQTVSVTAVDDALAEGNHSGAITHAVSGADYGSVAAAGVSVAITDNDGAGIVVTPTTGLVTTEAGGSATFTVVLASQPTADIGIALSSSDTTEGTVSPAALTFTAANWNLAQTVTVTGVDDAVVDGHVAYTVITAAATSADTGYAGVDAADVAASNRDDDGASLRIDDVTLAEGDAGSTAFVFTVTLTGTVAGGVRVNYATADGTAQAPGDYAATTGLLSFAGTDGETQTISVTVSGDTVFEGDELFRVVLSGADPAVVVLSRAEGMGRITDDDATAQLAATKVVTQPGTPLQPVVYTLVLGNTGTGPQADAAASDELVDTLPIGLALQSASADSGTVIADVATNTVRWNGALAAGASTTIEIRAAVVATAATSISNRAQVNYDGDGDGINDTTALSDDPTTPGADATVFFFAPAAPAVPVPLSGPWTLLALLLGLGGLGMHTTMRLRGAMRA